MTDGRMQFEFRFGRPRHPASRPDGEEPFRILVLGDLTGRDPAHRSVPLGHRTPLRVDVDNLERVFDRLSPRLDLTVAGAPLTVELRSLDDFHPDALFRRLAPFAALRKLRAELGDPALFRRAASALGAPPGAESSVTPSQVEETAADVERLLGRRPEAAPAAAPGAALMEHWLRELVAPHVVADTAREQEHYIAAADAAIAEQMRRLLHQPAFQALEATWRGISRLVTQLETGETLQVFLLDVARDELATDIATAGDDPNRSVLYRHLCGPDTEPPDGRRWSLLAADFMFGPSAEEVPLLAALGALAARAAAPLLAAASIEALGCAGIGQLPQPASWRPLAPEAVARWTALRTSAGAPWIGLALPRVLARLPYGANSDPIESFAFEELADSHEHEAYLWGNPAFALALLAGQAFQEEGWDMDLDRQLDVADLPGHTLHEGGEAKLQPCAEVLLSESVAAAVLAQGIMPLLSYRSRNAARLLRWQSLADPPRALQGVWA